MSTCTGRGGVPAFCDGDCRHKTKCVPYLESLTTGLYGEGRIRIIRMTINAKVALEIRR